MKDIFAEFAFEEVQSRSRSRTRSARMGISRAYRLEAEDGFTCKHCGCFVSSAAALAGVLNRNHCPYCLWSRHLDLLRPGDRMCACKAPMQPVALTLKKTRKKYGRAALGELMLVHRCSGCDAVSINRLAADDDPQAVMEVFERSIRAGLPAAKMAGLTDIQLLDASSRGLVREQLFGWHAALEDETILLAA